MKEYILQLETTALSLQWQFTVEMPSDEMVKQYAIRIAESDPVVRLAMALLVWDVKENKLVTRLVLDKPLVREALRIY